MLNIGTELVSKSIPNHLRCHKSGSYVCFLPNTIFMGTETILKFQQSIWKQPSVRLCTYITAQWISKTRLEEEAEKHIWLDFDHIPLPLPMLLLLDSDFTFDNSPASSWFMSLCFHFKFERINHSYKCVEVTLHSLRLYSQHTQTEDTWHRVTVADQIAPIPPVLAQSSLALFLADRSVVNRQVFHHGFSPILIFTSAPECKLSSFSRSLSHL